MNIIDKLSLRIAEYSVKHNPNSYSLEVTSFSFKIFFNMVLTILFTLLVSLFTGELRTAVIVIISIMLLRVVSGGVHLASGLGCSILTAVIFLVLTHVHVQAVPSVFIVLQGLSVIFLYLYAPKNIKRFFRLQPHNFRHLKWVAIAMVLLSSFLYSYTIALTFFFQALSITPVFEKLFAFFERRENS
ncbi:hypothetical protein GC093_10815 [Paenibacillus sp. LMG 31456]|uniref:Accessory regulator AgrB n=1 Tax=Paenibacillus foliorum TaxID=2654974 RepID=A0A972GN17_9BACL|nr:hypothetical protein [Paenibacillus foliorum]